MSKIIVNLDATALGSSGCILALQRTVVQGLKEPIMGASLIYGVAVYKYIDTMYKTKGHIPTAREEALRAFRIPKISAKKSDHLLDEKHMLSTCFNLWEFEIMGDKEFEMLEMDGKPASEITFSLPYYEDETITVNLCGTIDRVGKIKNGCYVIRDWKTTSSWDNKGYFKTYELSRQLRMYRLALRLMAQRFPESMLGKIGATNVGAQINAVFLKPLANDNKYGNSEVYQYSEKEIDDFELLLKAQIIRLSWAIRFNNFPKEGILNGACESKLGKCKFWNTCCVSDEIAAILLKRDFIVKEFNPLAYNE